MSNLEQEYTIKHIELIQNVVDRHAQNSFLLRGWSVTLFSIILVFVGTIGLNPSLVYFSLIPIICFWYLDAYYLRQERLYRTLYETVVEDLRNGSSTVELLDLSTAKFDKNIPSTLALAFSRTVILIPLSAIILCVAVSLILTV